MVILCYFLFEAYPVNYRPILINGFAEASYPSSTTLLTLTVMPTFAFLLENRMNSKFRNIIGFLAEIFSVFMVAGRLISGVHWITDIIGSLFLSAGLFCIYKAIVLFFRERRKNNGI